MIELEQPHYDRLSPLFKQPHLALVIKAMAAGNSPARIWADDPMRPITVCAWDTTHSLYFGGTINPVRYSGLRNLLEETILPEAAARDLGGLKLYSDADPFAVISQGLFPAASLLRRGRLFFRRPVAAESLPSVEPPSGVSVHPINQRLLESQHRNVELVLAEITACWPSVERFLANDFGFCVVVDNHDIVSWCTAEYVSSDQCGIGIETGKAHLNSGYATLGARAFIEHCRANRIVTHWDCWDTNIASIRVANKVGFVDPIAYWVYWYSLG